MPLVSLYLRSLPEVVLTTSTPRFLATAMTVLTEPKSQPTTDMFAVCDGGVNYVMGDAVNGPGSWVRLTMVTCRSLLLFASEAKMLLIWFGSSIFLPWCWPANPFEVSSPRANKLAFEQGLFT